MTDPSEQPDVAALVAPLDSAEVRELDERTQSLRESYQSYEVTTPAAFANGADHLRVIKTLKKELTEQRFALTRPIDAAKRAVLDFFRPMEARLDDAERRVKLALAGYKREQDDIAREEQRRRDAAARREREALAVRAREAEAKGREARAAALEARASQAVAPLVEPATPKTEGVSFREVWKFRVVDPAKVPREYLAVDEKKIGAVVRALKGDASIPGVEVYCDEVPAARAHR